MTNKKDLTIEELTKAYEEAKSNYNTIGEQLKKAKQEEEDRKKAQLALEKEARKSEVSEAWDNYSKLLKAYIKDYGSYTKITSSKSDDFDWFPNNFFRSFF